MEKKNLYRIDPCWDWRRAVRRSGKHIVDDALGPPDSLAAKWIVFKVNSTYTRHVYSEENAQKNVAFFHFSSLFA